jgi:hypothetical protein
MISLYGNFDRLFISDDINKPTENQVFTRMSQLELTIEMDLSVLVHNQLLDMRWTILFSGMSLFAACMAYKSKQEKSRTAVYLSVFAIIIGGQAYSNFPGITSYWGMQVGLWTVTTVALAYLLYMSSLAIGTLLWGVKKLVKMPGEPNRAANSLVLMLVLLFIGSVPGLIWQVKLIRRVNFNSN